MKKIISLLILSIVITGIAFADYKEIHCKHFFYGIPKGTPDSNDLIIRDIYALSSNDATKFADWVAYKLDKETVFGDVNTKRTWKADIWLDAEETLEPSDYKGAHKALKTDRGHQAPLASFKGTNAWKETNYLSNITPQKSHLNQGPWRILEDKIRQLTNSYDDVWVITGPYYETSSTLELPQADELHKVPSGYWKIILIQPTKNKNSIQATAFMFAQDTPRNDLLIDHITTIQAIQEKTGLDFLWQLEDSLENSIETQENEDLAEELIGA